MEVSEHSIARYFYFSKVFLDFCHENNLVRLKDLKEFDFSCLGKTKGIGRVMLKRIIEVYKDVTGLDAIYFDSCFTDSSIETSPKDMRKYNSISWKLTEDNTIKGICTTIDIHDDFKGLPLSSLDISYKATIIECLEIHGIDTLGDLCGVTEETLRYYLLIGEVIGIMAYKKFISCICDFSVSFDMWLQKEEKSIRDIKNIDYLFDRINGLTYIQIGGKYGVSKQRIKQRLVWISSRLDAFICAYTLKLIHLCVVCTEKLLCGRDFRLDDISTDMYNIYMWVIKDNANYGFSKHEKGDLYLYKASMPELCNVMNSIFRYNDSIIDLYDDSIGILYTLDLNGFDYIDQDSFLELCKVRGCVIRGSKILGDTNMNKSKIVARVVKDYFPNGISLVSDMDLDMIDATLVRDYGFDFAKNRRVISSNIEVNNNCIIWGNSTRIHIANVNIPSRVICVIGDFLKLHINSYDVSKGYSSVLYDILIEQDESIKLYITDYIKFYGICKYYFKDDYNFCKLAIQKGGSRSKTNLELLLDLLSVDVVLNFDDVVKKLNWHKYTLYNTLFDSTILVPLFENKYFGHVKDIDFDDALYQDIKSEIFLNISKYNYCNSSMLLDKFECRLAHLGVDTSISVGRLVKYLYADEVDVVKSLHIVKRGTYVDVSLSSLCSIVSTSDAFIGYIKENKVQSFYLDVLKLPRSSVDLISSEG